VNNDIFSSVVALDLFRDEGCWSVRGVKPIHLDSDLSGAIDMLVGSNSIMAGLCLMASSSRIIYSGSQSSRLLLFEGHRARIVGDHGIYFDRDIGLSVEISRPLMRAIGIDNTIPKEIFLSVYDVDFLMNGSMSVDIFGEDYFGKQDISLFETGR
jgi:hypothetical protein